MRPLARINLALCVALLLPSVQADQLAEASACAGQGKRLQRLACYDAVFGAPPVSAKYQPVALANQPERWRQAFAQADAEQAVVYRNTGRTAGHLVTVAALGAKPPRPLLMLQCHNNITELALMLPSPISDERVSVDLGAGRANWRVRGNGLLVSAGRGLPAIRTVKTLATWSDLSLSSSSSELDGLMFDLSGFDKAIVPLRAACGW